jgi:hypothetical protein
MTKKDKAKDYHLKRTYGITLKQYKKMLKDQNNSCKICKRHESEFSNSLAVDHDHKTNEIRGLLCFVCNKLIVGRHNKDSVKKLVEYILPEYELIKK